MALKHMLILRSLLLAFTLLIFSAQVAARDYDAQYSWAAQGSDGTWLVTMECRGTVTLDAWSWTREILIVNGSGQFQISDQRGGVTKGVLAIQGQKVTLRADGVRAPSASWQWRLNGIVSGGSSFSIEGPTYSQGSLQRTCYASGSLTRPAVSRDVPKSRAESSADPAKRAEQFWVEIAKQAQDISQPGGANAVRSGTDVPRSREPVNTTHAALQRQAKDQAQANAKASVQVNAQASANDQAQAQAQDLLAAVGVSSREEAMEVQTALRAFGFYRGGIDGVPGPVTRSAIVAWQRSEGLSPSGRLTVSQIDSLKKGPVVAQTQTGSLAEVIKPQSPAAPVPVPAPTVVVDPSAGSRVSSLQRDLERKFTSRVGPIAAQRLFVGNEGDIVLLTNENPRAPHFMRRVTGEGVFRDDKMNVCSLGTLAKLDAVFAQYAMRTLAKLNPDVVIQNVPPWATACQSLADSTRDDVVAVLRSDLISNVRLQEAVVTAIADKKLRWFGVIDRAPFEKLLDQQEQNRKILNAALMDGTLTGMGLLASESDKTVVCSTDTHDPEFAQRIVADIRLGMLSGKEPAADAQIVRGDIDDVFLRTKRGECGFILADAATLKLLSDALKRDGFPMSLVPVNVPKDKSESMLAQLQAERAEMSARAANIQTEKSQLAREAARQLKEQQAQALLEAERRRVELEQEARLEEVRRANDEAARLQELERIRRVVASRGRAIQDVLDARIRKHMQSVTTEVSDTKLRAKLGQVLSPQEKRLLDAQNEIDRLGQEFPQWSEYILARAKQEWDFGDIKASLEDYGQAKWRGRDIEAISIRVEFPMSNAIIGERTTDCRIFTWINDEEFKFWRQTLSTPCASYGEPFKKWAIANDFVSQWKLPASN